MDIVSDIRILKQGLQANGVEVERLKADTVQLNYDVGSIMSSQLMLEEGINLLNHNVGVILDNETNMSVGMNRVVDIVVDLKGDISDFQTNMNLNVVAMSQEMATKADIVNLSQEMATMKGDIVNLSQQMATKADIVNLSQEMATMKGDLSLEMAMIMRADITFLNIHNAEIITRMNSNNVEIATEMAAMRQQQLQNSTVMREDIGDLKGGMATMREDIVDLKGGMATMRVDMTAIREMLMRLMPPQ